MTGNENINDFPPQRSLVFKSLSDSQIKKPFEDEQKHLFDYKKIFDQTSTKIGISKPLMGGSGYQDKILDGNSKTDITSVNISLLSQKPMLNLLFVPGLAKRGFLTRYLYYTYYITSRPIRHKYPSINKMKKSVLSDEKVQRAILFTMQKNKSNQIEDHGERNKLMRNAAVMVDEMLATVSTSAIRFCGWLFISILRRLTSAIHVHQGQIEILKKIVQDDKPIIYFPLHFSHFDYILLSLVVYWYELRSPFVASGNNLLIQPFSSIMRRVGGFFIRRKIDGNDKDLIYRAVLHSYITKLLEKKQSLEIFIEGTRTRSGLPNLPKTGLLSVAVECLSSVDITDITLVPVCISYEKLLEGTFRRELMGDPKKPETFISSIINIFKMFCGFYGHIRVNFGVPQSMTKTLRELGSSPACSFSCQIYPKLQTLCGQDSTATSLQTSVISKPGAAGMQNRHEHKTLTHNSSFNSTSLVDEHTRELVTFLGERIVYNSIKCKVFMSTNIISFLLLHRWRNGVTLTQLVDSFKRLTTELFTRKCDVGFSGDYKEVVLHAINLLGNEVVEMDCAYSHKLKRFPSNASIRSKSADSGYDLEEFPEGPSFDKPFVKHQRDLKATPSSSDSGEELDFSEHDEPSTGGYMAITEDRSSTLSSMLSPTNRSRVQRALRRKYLNEPIKSPKSNLTIFVEPVINAPQVFDLAYYANALTPVFALESIVALAVNSITQYRLSTFEKKLHILVENSSIEYVQLNVDDLPESICQLFRRNQLIDKSLELVDLLQMDLILCDVTQNLEEAVNETIDTLIARGCLTSDDIGNSAALQKTEIARQLGFDDFEISADQWIKVNLEELPTLLSTQSVMASFVEGYVAASTKLTCLLQYPLSEDHLIREMLKAAQARVKDGLATRDESCSSEIIRNAVRSFEWNGILLRNEIFKKEFNLSAEFQDAQSIANLVSRLSQFLF